MRTSRMTVTDLLAQKGKRQMSMLYVTNVEEACSADEAGIDILSILSSNWTPQMRQAAGNCFVQVALSHKTHVTSEDFWRGGHAAMNTEADAVYCIAKPSIVEELASSSIPVASHAGLIPAYATWTGGFKAVGKTAASAMAVFDKIKALENAGAIALELECVPDRIASEITSRTPMIVESMGSGSGCDAQFLFAMDVLGYTQGHFPRHAKAYRDFTAEYARLHKERVGAFQEYIADMNSGSFPAQNNIVPVADAELDRFLKLLEHA